MRHALVSRRVKIWRHTGGDACAPAKLAIGRGDLLVCSALLLVFQDSGAGYCTENVRLSAPHASVPCAPMPHTFPGRCTGRQSWQTVALAKRRTWDKTRPFSVSSSARRMRDWLLPFDLSSCVPMLCSESASLFDPPKPASDRPTQTTGGRGRRAYCLTQARRHGGRGRRAYCLTQARRHAGRGWRDCLQ
jgi:hypothetical protein